VFNTNQIKNGFLYVMIVLLRLEEITRTIDMEELGKANQTIFLVTKTTVLKV
jgi:hypothetical protein